jgi:hypothetical protein
VKATARRLRSLGRVLRQLAARGTLALAPLLLAAFLPATPQPVDAPGRPAPDLTVPTAPTDLSPPPQSSLAEAVEAIRRSWAGQDPAAIVAQSRQLLLQLPGSDSRSAVSRGQAARLLAGLLRRAEAVQVRVVAAREVEPGQGYAELVRQYRVAGTGEARQERILLAFRRDPSRGVWELVELRVLQGGG